FVGLSSANHIGFYGHHGAGWGLVMSVSNGFVGIGTTTPTNRLHVIGTVQATAYITGSDRNAKDNIQPVEPAAILDKVANLPISTWTFRDEPNGTHIGPMAQDFHAAFGFGNTDTGIMTVDADGVALAAIQALAQRNEELSKENDALRARLEAVERKLGM
ncbi:MAG TPA: tail fiber domain-containing protein, partial [Kiritimatiellia bacterium]|nr:tail fiber domain-containing protein [Kiritimatiellia bacterium]HMP00792.1 tail fiber domain-containing protein [Kiritimatiellia bacterium]